MRTIPPLLIAVTIAACQSAPERPSSGKFSGRYVHGVEISRFTPEGSTEKWWLDGRIPCLPPGDSTATGVTLVYLELDGQLSPPGSYGPLGAYSRELQVGSVSVCRVVKG